MPTPLLPPRRIAHLDMDAYFASVELLRYPELKGQPVVIGGRRRTDPEAASGFQRLRGYAGRGVVTTATYEARKFGVRSGMGLMKAAVLAPDAILLPGDYETYSRVSRTFKAAVAEIVPQVEDRGIDEIYLDLTEVPGATRELAQRLKDAVRQATGLSCSIGVTPNKLLSKLASELEKPDGLTILGLEDIPTRIWPLTTSREPKSISCETTFERDLHPKIDREELSRILLKLCERLAKDLARKGYQARCVGIKLRFEDFSTLTRDHSIEVPIADADALREAARACLRRVTLDRKLRLLGIRAGSLVKEGAYPPPQAGLDRVAEPGPALFADLEP